MNQRAGSILKRSRGAPGFGVLALALVLACKKGEDEAASDSTHAEVAVRTAVVMAAPFVETVNAIGNVVARAGHVAALSAPAPTRVAQVRVAPGQHVTKGEQLVELEQTVFQANVRSASAAVDAAQRNL